MLVSCLFYVSESFEMWCRKSHKSIARKKLMPCGKTFGMSITQKHTGITTTLTPPGSAVGTTTTITQKMMEKKWYSTSTLMFNRNKMVVSLQIMPVSDDDREINTAVPWHWNCSILEHFGSWPTFFVFCFWCLTTFSTFNHCFKTCIRCHAYLWCIGVKQKGKCEFEYWFKVVKICPNVLTISSYFLFLTYVWHICVCVRMLAMTWCVYVP